MLDEAVRLALEHRGVRTRSVFVAEWDAYASACLRSRMEETALESCPIWCGDLREFPAEDFCGLVDGLVCGFPCQDISCAGKGAGIRGSRSGVWFDILDAAVRMGARYLFLENVSAITSRGLDAVLGSLSEVGFDAEWTLLRASEVGASHRRERWFCVARRNEFGGQRGGELLDGQRETQRHDTDGCDTELADTSIGGQRKLRQPPECNGLTDGSIEIMGNSQDENGSLVGQQRDNLSRPHNCGGVGHTERQRSQGRRLTQSERWHLTSPPNADWGIFAPGPGDPRWPSILRDSPHLAPAIEPGFRLLADGMADSLDCPICHWAAYVREWRRRMRYELEQICGEKTGSKIEENDSIMRAVRENVRDRRASPGHQKPPYDCGLRVSEVSPDTGPDSRHAETEQRSQVANETSDDVQPLRSKMQGTTPDILQPPMCSSGEGNQSQVATTGNSDDMLGVQGIHSGQDSQGSKILQSPMCNHTSKFAIDDFRADQLRCGGNGVVAIQGAAAFIELIGRMK